MIELNDESIRLLNRNSSKGNQLKWNIDNVWYKADYAGYEGLSEYIVDEVLKRSNLSDNEFAHYTPEQIKYKKAIFNGVKSKNFLKPGWQIITLERYFKDKYNRSLTQAIWKIPDISSRLEFLVDQVVNETGLEFFGIYMCKILEIDALFLNEDRHMHNVAILMNSRGDFDYCPIFDHGAALLSDTTMDYPSGIDVISEIKNVKGKTISSDFDEALDAAESLFGVQINIDIRKKELEEIVYANELYSNEIKERVIEILMNQYRKYQYIFN